MEKTLLVSENNLVTIKSLDSKLIRSILIDAKSQCFGCENASPLRCSKVEDEVKKYIWEYKFIKDGYQVLDKDENVDKFIVTKCNNYVEDPKRHRPTTKEEIAALIRLKESIKILYFDAEDIKEADQIHEDLINRGSIIK